MLLSGLSIKMCKIFKFYQRFESIDQKKEQPFLFHIMFVYMYTHDINDNYISSNFLLYSVTILILNFTCSTIALILDSSIKGFFEKISSISFSNPSNFDISSQDKSSTSSTPYLNALTIILYLKHCFTKMKNPLSYLSYSYNFPI